MLAIKTARSLATTPKDRNMGRDFGGVFFFLQGSGQNFWGSRCSIPCFDIVLYYTILYYTILYYTIMYYTILCYTILYYTILYKLY